MRRRGDIAHCQSPEPVPFYGFDPQRVLRRPFMDVAAIPLGHVKGRRGDAELGLSDRLTPPADYWIR